MAMKKNDFWGWWHWHNLKKHLDEIALELYLANEAIEKDPDAYYAQLAVTTAKRTKEYMTDINDWP